MVDFESRLNSFRVNRLKRLDLPTPESPIRTTMREEIRGSDHGKNYYHQARQTVEGERRGMRYLPLNRNYHTRR